MKAVPETEIEKGILVQKELVNLWYNYGKVESPYNTSSLSPQFFSESPKKPILKAKDNEDIDVILFTDEN